MEEPRPLLPDEAFQAALLAARECVERMPQEPELRLVGQRRPPVVLAQLLLFAVPHC